jgi:hypothetical protein
MIYNYTFAGEMMRVQPSVIPAEPPLALIRAAPLRFVKPARHRAYLLFP